MNNASTDSYMKGIDGLRAIAVLSVIIYHFNERFLPGGFTGVDVFFVVSGYVISKSLASREWSGFDELIVNFYKRRMLRIFPALMFLLIAASIFHALFVPNQWLSGPNKVTALAAFFGVSNIFLVSAADGYFSDRIPFNPYVHTWSLAVEEQFYLFFPFAFYFWLKAGGKDGIHHCIAAWMLPAAAVVSLALSAYQSSFARDHAFYLLPSRVWELAAGAILLQLQLRHGLNSRVAHRSASMLAAGAALLVVGFVFADKNHFPFPWALLPVAGTLLMVAGTTGGSASPSGLRALIESDTATYIGRISYSLYLWHWPVFSFFRWTVGMEGWIPQSMAVLLTLGLGAFSYHCIENRCRRSHFVAHLPNWKAVTGGVVLIGASAVSVASLFLVTSKYQLSLSTVNKERSVWNNEYEIPSPAPVDARAVGLGRKIFLVGDSHAGAFRSMAAAAAGTLGAEVKFLARSGCPIARLITAARNNERCENFAEETVGWIKQQARPGDVVFFASLRVPRFGDQWGLFDQDAVQARSALPDEIRIREIALDQAVELAKTLRASGLNVLMNAPLPIFKAPPFRCSDWFNRSNPICLHGFTMDRSALQAHREPTMVSLRVLHDLHQVHVWDPFPVVCNGPVCSAFDGDKPLFIDGDHLSGHGSRALIPSFTNQLLEIWRGEGAVEMHAQHRGPSVTD